MRTGKPPPKTKLDPEVFVIGGGLAEGGGLLFERLKHSYQKYAYLPCKDTKIIKAGLGNDAGIWGAAKLILDKGE